MKRAALKPEMKLGAEPKKVAVLIGLIIVAIGAYWYMSQPDTGQPAAATPTAPAPTPLRSMPATPAVVPPGRTGQRGQSRGPRSGIPMTQEFRPTLKPKDPIDAWKVDPTLRLTLLAKLQNVSMEGGGRSLFDFAGAPAPKVDIPKVKPILPGETAVAAFVGPKFPKPAPEPPKPPPAPIPLKFYGFNTLKAGIKRAFFLEGDDIYVAGEGDLIKNRYKVVRIGINSAVVEDTTDKHQQTLPLEAEQVNS